jgi:hypothetical protein
MKQLAITTNGYAVVIILLISMFILSSTSTSSDGENASSNLFASADNSVVIDTNDLGDIQNPTSGLLTPTPGSWEGLGGYIKSNPFIVKIEESNFPQDTHIFVVGGDNALWDNMNGNWIRLGGYLTSNPCFRISGTIIDIYARGSDNSLWTCNFNTHYMTYQWYPLGGMITSDPTHAPSYSGMDNSNMIHDKIFARGGDGNLWKCDVGYANNIPSGTWELVGLNVKQGSNPHAMADGNKNLHVFFRQNDDSLYDSLLIYKDNGPFVNSEYIEATAQLGGKMTSDPIPVRDTNYHDPLDYIHVYARGSDGALWDCALSTGALTETGTLSSKWYNLGGYISPGGSGSSIYKGNPDGGFSPNTGYHVIVRGGDGALWDNNGDFGGNDGFYTSSWKPLGGYVTSDPIVLRNYLYGTMQGELLNTPLVGARGGDGAVWEYMLN